MAAAGCTCARDVHAVVQHHINALFYLIPAACYNNHTEQAASERQLTAAPLGGRPPSRQQLLGHLLASAYDADRQSGKSGAAAFNAATKHCPDGDACPLARLAGRSTATEAAAPCLASSKWAQIHGSEAFARRGFVDLFEPRPASRDFLHPAASPVLCLEILHIAKQPLEQQAHLCTCDCPPLLSQV